MEVVVPRLAYGESWIEDYLPTDVLAEGVWTAPDARNACGWADIASVLPAMSSGATYVNVHTDDGVDPTNTGPGDFPGGEIRGQVRAEDDD